MCVDELIILASNMDMINELKSSLEHEFEMSNLGELHAFLEVHFERDRGTCTITMKQQSYIKGILEQFGNRALQTHWNLTWYKDLISKAFEGGTWEAFIWNERNFVSKSSVVVDIRDGGHKSDLAFEVSVVYRIMSKLGPMHWMIVKKIMQYLKDILDMRLRMVTNIST